MEDNFSGKTLLITGGTGSFGNAVLKRFLQTDIGEIRIFSRDEKKQDELRTKYQNPKLRFFLGDVRDSRSIQPAVNGADYVFHAAALKQVPSCEFFPMEAIKTNVLGTENVLQAAVSAGVNRVVCLSTDKAVYPINAMGMSKALMEKVITAVARTLTDGQTTICATRYGNVMASRGSVIPLFLKQMHLSRPLTLTNPEMTRFMMSLDDAVDLVLYAFENGNNGELFVQKAPGATIRVLADAILKVCDRPDQDVQTIGTRHGEKLYEVLLSREERLLAADEGDYFRVPTDSRDLNYSNYVEQGDVALSEVVEYTSHNTHQLNVDEMSELLMKLEIVRSYTERGVLLDSEE